MGPHLLRLLPLNFAFPLFSEALSSIGFRCLRRKGCLRFQMLSFPEKGRGHKRNADTYDKPLPDGVLAGSLASDRFFPVVQVQTTN